MESVRDKIQQMREERIAREKARIDKLKEMNLKKYNNGDLNATAKSISNTSVVNKCLNKTTLNNKTNNTLNNRVRPSTAPMPNLDKNLTTNKINLQQKSMKTKEKSQVNVLNKPHTDVTKTIDTNIKRKPFTLTFNSYLNKDLNKDFKKPIQKPTLSKEHTNKNHMKTIKNDVKPNSARTVAPSNLNKPSNIIKNTININKFNVNNKSTSSNPNRNTRNAPQTNEKKITVFERLYKPKMLIEKRVSNIDKVQTDPSYRSKLIKDSNLILNKRHTVFEPKPQEFKQNIRRSISAIHLKRLSRSELPKCFHKWSSIGEKLDKVALKETNEDAAVKTQTVTSAIKSERKKCVKFQKGTCFNLNTPTGDELQSRLKSWLQKRGKSLNSYHHLQCFGIHHLAQTATDALKFKPYDEENKENIEQSDGDDNSYTDNLNDRKQDFGDKWRNVSSISDSVDFNTTQETSMTSEEITPMHHVDELLLGALNDLTELLREGFDWEQCARWLRALRERFPAAPNSAAYWECRAALEERQGNFPGSVECWEEAIAKGTERSVVEANLDQLLDKFMQLKISPNAGKKPDADRKIVDVKNVFKSTLIRFAVQQAKLRKSDGPKYVATPVRRSSRISTMHTFSEKKATPLSCKKRTPLVQLCSSMRHIDEEIKSNMLFVPNKTLEFTP